MADGLAMTDVARKLAEMWGGIAAEEKKQYQEANAIEMAQYKEAMARYKEATKQQVVGELSIKY